MADLTGMMQAAAGAGGVAIPSNIVFVGGTTLAAIGQTADITVDLTNLTSGLATQPAEDDLVLVIFSAGVNTARNFVTAGYTELCNLQANTSNIDHSMCAGYKFMSSSPDTQVVVQGSGSTLASSAICVQVWRYVDQSDPFPLVETRIEYDNTQPTPPPINPPSGSFNIAVGAGSSTGIPNTPYTDPGDFDEFTTTGSADTIRQTSGLGGVGWIGGIFTPSKLLIAGTTTEVNIACSSFTAIMRST